MLLLFSGVSSYIIQAIHIFTLVLEEKKSEHYINKSKIKFTLSQNGVFLERDIF